MHLNIFFNEKQSNIFGNLKFGDFAHQAHVSCLKDEGETPLVNSAPTFSYFEENWNF